MTWARVTLVAGLLLLFVAFAYGTENDRSVSVVGQRYDCGAAISPSWLVPGAPETTLSPGQGQSENERRAATACGQVIRESRVAMLTAMGVGGLLALIGWTVLREQDQPEPHQVDTVRR